MRSAWHIWVVGILALVFNGGGAFDYVMTKTQNPSYMGQFTDAQLDFFYSFPAWVVACWATAVWSAVLGSLLILLRNRWAASMFGISILAMTITSIHNFVLSEVKMQDVTGFGAVAFMLVIFGVTLFLFFYCRAMATKGALY